MICLYREFSRLIAILFRNERMTEKKLLTVNIEGNVGSGKSMLLDHFKSFSDVLILEEDLEKWTNVHVSYDKHNQFS